MTFMTVWSTEPCPHHHLIAHGEIDDIGPLENLRSRVEEYVPADTDPGDWYLTASLVLDLIDEISKEAL